MAMSINHNLATAGSAKSLQAAMKELMNNSKRLSSGLRIASAADDAAGLAISERLRSKIASLSQASRNAFDGVSLAQTAEGGLEEVSGILARLGELSVQAKNGTLSDTDRETLQAEASDLISQIDQVAGSTQFNGINLLDGTTSTVELDVSGSAGSAGEMITVDLESMTADGLGLTDFSIGPGSDPAAATASLEEAIDRVSTYRARLGSTENRLNSSISGIDTAITSLVSAESRIRDVDVARETAEQMLNKIKMRAALSIHAQAGVQPQVTLSLLEAP